MSLIIFLCSTVYYSLLADRLPEVCMRWDSKDREGSFAWVFVLIGWLFTCVVDFLSSLALCSVPGIKPSMCKAFNKCWMDEWNINYVRIHLFLSSLENSPSSCLYVKETFSKPGFMSSLEHIIVWIWNALLEPKVCALRSLCSGGIGGGNWEVGLSGRVCWENTLQSLSGTPSWPMELAVFFIHVFPLWCATSPTVQCNGANKAWIGTSKTFSHRERSREKCRAQ